MTKNHQILINRYEFFQKDMKKKILYLISSERFDLSIESKSNLKYNEKSYPKKKQIYVKSIKYNDAKKIFLQKDDDIITNATN